MQVVKKNHNIYNSELQNIQTELVNRLCKKIEIEKLIILKNALKEKKIDIDLSKENNNRFKKLKVEFDGFSETYYYDDGTESGLRLVSFLYSNKINTDFINSGFVGNINCEIKYKYY